MKHDIPLLKSDLDFKWLSAWCLLLCSGLAKKYVPNGNRNCKVFSFLFFFEQRIHSSNNFLHKHFYAWRRFSLIMKPIVVHLLVNMNIFQHIWYALFLKITRGIICAMH